MKKFIINNYTKYFILAGISIFIIPSLTAESFRSVRAESVGMSTKRLERLTEQLDHYVDSNQLSGGVALVLRNGKAAYFHSFGYRDLDQKDPMEKDDIFRIASQTKSIISVAIMILQEKGQLLIQDPVGDYIPEFNNTTVAVEEDGNYSVVKSNRKITIRDLLTHTSGIGWGVGPGKEDWEKAGIVGWYFADKDETIQETVKRIAKLPMDAQPGDDFVYGLSTDILGALIEVVSKQPLDQFLRQEIFDPLNMKDTHFYLPLDKLDRLTTVYSSTESGVVISPDPGKRKSVSMIGQGHYVTGPRKSFSGGAGLLSTAEDYASFLQMILNGGTFNKNRILSRKTVELMTVDHIGGIKFPWESGIGVGLGFWILKDLGRRGTPGTIGEYGWGGAYHSTYWVDPEESLVVVYFTQLIPALNIDDHDKLRTLIYQSLIN